MTDSPRYPERNERPHHSASDIRWPTLPAWVGTTSQPTPRPCRGNPPKTAVIGPHIHWNGDFYAVCPDGERCDIPSCHPAELEDYKRTLVDVRYQRDEALERLSRHEADQAQRPEQDVDPGVVLQCPPMEAIPGVGFVRHDALPSYLHDHPRGPFGPDARRSGLDTCYASCRACRLMEPTHDQLPF